MPWSCTLICTSAELSPIPTRSADIPPQRLWPLYFTALAIRFCKHWDSSDRSPATGGKSGFISLLTVKISNGVLRAKVYLPDGEKGFYRGMRFDWAGVMASLEYKSHGYLGPFFEKFDPAVSDVEIGNPVVAGIASAASGPVEEFIGADESAFGYSEAKPGETFCKIGVGALRKIDNAPYSSYVNYPIVNGGKRSTESGADWIEFTQQGDCGSGYGYEYTKTIDC
jgi:hypothetical protein